MIFALSKILWMFTAPGNFLVLLLLTGVFLATAAREDLQVIGKRLCFDVAFLFFLIAIFPVGNWMLLPLENLFPPAKLDHVDGIIVIGGDENPELTEARNQPGVHASADYYLAFAALAHQYPQAKLVFSGGSNRLRPDTASANEAGVAKEALTTLGLSPDRITFEEKSRNTHENAVDAAALVHPKPSEKWLLVTSAFHMPRAIASFRKAGWNIYAAPADYHTNGQFASELNFNFVQHLTEMTIAAHEYYGLIAYRLLGYTDTVWPQ